MAEDASGPVGGLIQTVARSWGAVTRHPFYSTLGASGLVVVFDWITRLQSGFGMMETWFGPDWLAAVVGSAWFKVGALIIAVGCFLRIGVLARREERTRQEEMRAVRETGQREAVAQMSSMLEEATAFTKALALREVRRRDNLRFLEGFDIVIQHWLPFRNLVLDHPDQSGTISYGEIRSLKEHAARLSVHLSRLSAYEPAQSPQPSPIEINENLLVAYDPSNMRLSENPSILTELMRFHTEAEKIVHEYEEIKRQRERELISLDERCVEEMARLK